MTETREIEIISTILLLPVFLFGLTLSFNFAVGTLLGGILATANFFLLNRGIRGVFNEQQKKTRFFFQYTLRFIILVSIIYLVLCWKNIDVAGFIVGLSTIFLGIVLSAIKNKLRPQKRPVGFNEKEQRGNLISS